MKAWRYISFTAGCVFTFPIALYLLATVGVLPSSGFFDRWIAFFYIEVGYWLHEVGEPGFLSSTAGHMPHLTVIGVFLIYALPACVSFWTFWRLRTKQSHETTVA